MSRWRTLLLVALPLALALTAAFRFIQHTDGEYSFWVQTYGEIATLLEARCTATRSPAVCARAGERRALANDFKAYRDAVLAWWWPTLFAMLAAWLAAMGSGIVLAVAAWRRHRIRRGPSREPFAG